MTSLPAFFQPALSALAPASNGFFSDRLGEIVTGMDDINQCIHVILLTPRGSDPHRPLFGSLLHLYIDAPIDSARPFIVREVVDALAQWEPRIRVLRVRVTLSDVAALHCAVEWVLADGADSQIFSTELPLGSAA